ncbi:tripeptidyl-peptidase I [Ceratobasidium sp. AG-Ba]|nr:tripeptidyl-peptidase I [Ceratobasidium sp. AG-Ba]
MYLLSLLAFVAVSSASSLTTRHVLHRVPSGWTSVAPAPSDHLIDMRIGLKQGRMDELLATLVQVSNPGHERYGMYLSKSQVEALVAPRQDTIEFVEGWLKAHGVNITRRSSAGDWIHALVPVKRAEKMLNTRYNIYRHTSGEHVVRAESYALPRSLDDHVDVIEPTTFFGTRKDKPSRAIEKRESPIAGIIQKIADMSNCSATTTPKCLKSLYKTSGYTPSGIGRSMLGIVGYLEQYASHIDYQVFNTLFHLPALLSGFAVELVNEGKNNELLPGDEGNLDTQYGGAMTYPMRNIYYSVGGRPSEFTADAYTPANRNEPYVEWLNYMLAKSDSQLPLTITTSYGDNEQTVPFDYAQRVCNDFAQLGARGVSLLFSSGDNGVGPGNCTTNTTPEKKQFVPIFPASCPWVTAVGATTGMSPERAAVFSQGGFSNYFAQPDYQAGSVNAYLTGLGNTYDGLYNKSGRGFPDVSAQGQNYLVIQNAILLSINGTSASSPTFAGVIALVNDYRMSNGKRPLGFLNPWLYSNSAMLNDITIGNNPGCETDGFSAAVGWDPVTGLGTPDFEQMKGIL